ncbi:MAG: RNA methyltransferase, partial [Bacteroidales bacterium]|nr:RNA methyltransferase [Bacteroidales bacterium]
METITSAQNPKVKKLLALQEKSRSRREEGLFVVEGRRELEHCIEAGYEIDSVFICEEIASDPEDLMRRFETSGGVKVFSVSKEVYEKISYRGSTEGVVAEVRWKQLKLKDLRFKDNPLIIVLESVEKPGNLGAVLRSADA